MTKTFLKLIALSAGLSAAPAQAMFVDLFDWAIAVDGVTVDSLTAPGSDGSGYYTPVAGDFGALGANVNVSGFDFSDGIGSGGGLGEIVVSLTGAGNHYIGGYFDHEIDELDNGFDNEHAVILGVPVAGQSFEADEPGFVFGDIFDNVLANALDNTNDVDPGFEDDVAMAMAFDFALSADEIAIVTFSLTDVRPTSGFAIEHHDPLSMHSIFLSSDLRIRPLTPNVSAPATLGLLGLTLLAAGARRRA